MTRPVPVDAKRSDWPRLVANAINLLLERRPREGDTRYTQADGLQYYDGTDWQDVP